MSRYAVIGSNCFSASHLVDAFLAAGHEVIAISRSPEAKALYLPYKHRRPQPKFFQIDLTNDTIGLMRLLDREKPEVIVNYAALSEVGLSNTSPNEYFRTNTLGTVAFCNELRQRVYLRRYIHISSAEIYGPCGDYINEDAPLRPSTPYAVSKAAADLYILTLVKNFSFPGVLVRSTNVYGAHQQLFKIIPRSAIYLRLKKKILLHGGGASVKSFIHIRDVVRGIEKIIDKENPYPIYHFSTNNNLTIRQIVELVCRLMGFNFNDSVEIVGERLGQDSRYLLDSRRAARELEWKPLEDFEKGVTEVIEWVGSNWPQIVHEPLEYVHKV